MPCLPGLNSERSKQLFQFLENLTYTTQQKPNDHENACAHMIGIISSIINSYTSNATYYSCKLENGIWILDSGASDHMSSDANTLHDLQPLDSPVSVSLLNGHRVHVTHSGKLKLNDILPLNYVFVVPHFKYNLLFVKKLASQLHCNVTFLEELSVLQGPSLKRQVEIGKEACGLYILDKRLVQDAKITKDLFSVYNNVSAVLDNAF